MFLQGDLWDSPSSEDLLSSRLRNWPHTGRDMLQSDQEADEFIRESSKEVICALQ